MYQDRVFTLYTLLDSCIASMSVILCKTIPIKETFSGIVYQKQYQCDGLNVGLKMVAAYSDGLVDILPKYCIDVKVINN